ncbi:MAG: hypothetical protein ACR2OZ_11155 [Verrucomicrobiales bacterium]
MAAILQRTVWLLVVSAGMLMARGQDKNADETFAAADISIGFESALIKTGFLEQNRRGAFESLAAPVRITVQNRSGSPCTTSAEITGKNADLAEVELDKTENTPVGQELLLKVLGLKPSTSGTETFLTIETKQDGAVKAKKSLPVRVVIPASVKTGNPVIYDGPAVPGLVNRALNMRTHPKAAVAPPEAKLASMCVHDLTMTALDQFGEPLPEIYERAAVFAALGESDYETTNRRLTKNSTWIDIAGLWQFVGGVSHIDKEPDRTTVAQFTSAPSPPCTEAQYRAYDPLTLQWQIGGHVAGTYERQVTLLDSGNPHKPNMRITLVRKTTNELEKPVLEN